MAFPGDGTMRNGFSNENYKKIGVQDHPVLRKNAFPKKIPGRISINLRISEKTSKF
jgi:hypothetical protein